MQILYNPMQTCGMGRFFEKIYKPMQEKPETWARTFLSYIVTDKKWAMIYVDDNSVIFLKDTIDNKALISKFRK